MQDNQIPGGPAAPNNAFQEQLAELAQQIMRIENTLLEKQQALQEGLDTLTRILQMSDEHAVLNQEQVMLSQARIGLADMMKKARAENKKLAGQLRCIEQENERLKSELQEKEVTNHKLKAENSKKKEEAASIQALIQCETAKKKEKAKLQREIAALEKKIEELNATLKKQAEEVQEKEAELGKIQHEIEESLARQTALSNEATEIAAKEQDQLTKTATLEDKESVEQHKVRDAKGQVDTARKKLAAEKREVKAQKEKLEAKQEEELKDIQQKQQLAQTRIQQAKGKKEKNNQISGSDYYPYYALATVAFLYIAWQHLPSSSQNTSAPSGPLSNVSDIQNAAPMEAVLGALWAASQSVWQSFSALLPKISTFPISPHAPASVKIDQLIASAQANLHIISSSTRFTAQEKASELKQIYGDLFSDLVWLKDEYKAEVQNSPYQKALMKSFYTKIVSILSMEPGSEQDIVLFEDIYSYVKEADISDEKKDFYLVQLKNNFDMLTPNAQLGVLDGWGGYLYRTKMPFNFATRYEFVETVNKFEQLYKHLSSVAHTKPSKEKQFGIRRIARDLFPEIKKAARQEIKELLGVSTQSKKLSEIFYLALKDVDSEKTFTVMLDLLMLGMNMTKPLPAGTIPDMPAGQIYPLYVIALSPHCPNLIKAMVHYGLPAGQLYTIGQIAALIDQLSTEQQTTALHAAASAGHLDNVKELIALRANVLMRDIHKNTALHSAIAHPRVVEYLLKVKPSASPLGNADSHTAFILAVEKGFAATVQVFLDRKAVSNADLEKAQQMLIHAPECDIALRIQAYLQQQPPKLANLISEGWWKLLSSCGVFPNKQEPPQTPHSDTQVATASSEHQSTFT